MKVVSSHQRRVLADNDIPVALGELLGSLADILTRDVFQVEINRRLGALLRVAGIELQIVPHETEPIGTERTKPDRVRLSVQFVDGDYDLLFTFGLAQLSERSKRGVYDTAITVLTDYLKIVSLSGPVALWRFRRQTRDNRRSRLLSQENEAPIAESVSDASITPSLSETTPTVYTPQYNAAGFAHRLRNLLTAIMSGSSQLASTDRSRFDSDYLLLVKMIENASVLQEELIRRYLMTYGSLRLTLRSLDLGVALRSAVECHDSEYGCPTEITAEGDRTEVTTDSEILRQIIVEVLKNAHEASGGEKVTLRWSVADRQALIMIKNRGHINNADLDGVLSQPFYTTKIGHAGLGLSIARRYAGYLGGTIKGLSLHGYTIVTICLPLTRNENISLDKERESQCPPY
ncbi:MAG: HAMP domain-containing sensor histidine kinase [candidate division Zixibacteria bacterium]|nr:HAMP domain-containing sensor histidine kinase [candidate division Zixibacteria bacterium]